MMFNKFFAISALTSLAAATALPGGGGGSGGSETQCCKQVQQASDVDPITKSTILSLIGIDLDDVTGIVGLNCSPITVIGGHNGACSGGTTEVNCTDNSHGNLISLGCIPVTV
ncbi:hypothetical protein E1B28_007994 [Marasmius oreades]|uniref:Hydrophobin n=1 Tax=Marasmius oreades TaxID=181124 RepID=A0A9P7S2U3_9AGAR|nr:uncharacterized protein E1B28_007994 [Marasmius oreades]KAG7094394.1 hypothetical protein E1B28_007994 [Marasmius oreades]